MKLEQIKNFILDLLFPIECLGCGKEGEWVCEQCFDLVEVEKVFQELDISENYLDGFFCALSYDQKLVKDILHSLKYNFVKDLAEPLSKLMIKYLQENDLNFNQIDYVAFVPLHPKRELQRGFNQAELLAGYVADFLKKPLLPKNVLIRKKHTKSQVQVRERDLRRENVRGIFACRDCHCEEGIRKPFLAKAGAAISNACIVPPLEKGGRGDFKNILFHKKILLIDDVSTTGATLAECAKVLKESGADKVIGLVAAKN